MKTSSLFQPFALFFLLCLSPLAQAENVKLESLTVIELKASEGKAVVQYPDGKEYKLKVGEGVPGAPAVVVQVLPDKLVVEAIVEKEEYVTKQTVLLHKPESAGDESRVEWVEHNGYTRKVLELPESGDSSQ